MKTSSVRARITPELKHETEEILLRLGLTTSEAIELFFYQIKLHQGIPFKIRIPNQITLETFNNTDLDKNIIRCKDKTEMFYQLDI